MKPPYTIVVDLLWGGFDGKDVDDIRPDFVTDRPVRCQLQWAPSCEGPHSYRIYVEFGIIASFLLQGFFRELAKDIYRWSKSGLGRVFNRKPNGSGYAEIKFKDTKIVIPQHPSTPDFSDVWLGLPDAMETTNLSNSSEWVVSLDAETRKVTLVPVHSRISTGRQSESDQA